MGKPEKQRQFYRRQVRTPPQLKPCLGKKIQIEKTDKLRRSSGFNNQKYIRLSSYHIFFTSRFWAPRNRDPQVQGYESIKLSNPAIPPGPRGFKDWRLQGSIPSSRDRVSLVSQGEVLLAIELSRARKPPAAGDIQEPS